MNYKKGIYKNCEVCGKEYYVKQSEQDSKYCSHDCYNKARKNTKTCPICKTEFKPRRSTTKYCSEKCQAEGRKRKVTLTCHQCGKEFEVPECSSNRKYCSKKCTDESMKNGAIFTCEYCGKKYTHTKTMQNIKYCSADCAAKARMVEKIKITCRCCGKIFEVLPCRKKRAKFCSTSCRTIYTLQNIRGETSIEKKVREWLEEHNINHIPQYKIHRFCVNFYLPDSKIIIEAWGDYFHANPNAYGHDKKERDTIQKKDVKIDKMKRTYFTNRGYRFISLWETDINNDVDKIMKLNLYKARNEHQQASI